MLLFGALFSQSEFEIRLVSYKECPWEQGWVLWMVLFAGIDVVMMKTRVGLIYPMWWQTSVKDYVMPPSPMSAEPSLYYMDCSCLL